VVGPGGPASNRAKAARPTSPSAGLCCVVARGSGGMLFFIGRGYRYP